MLRSARLTISLCLLGGVTLAVVIGWSTGLFARITAVISELWHNLMAWINSPLSWDHVMAGAGILAVPIILLVVIFAIADR